jgi:hypothetical protein
MCLKVVEQNRHRDIIIKQGEVNRNNKSEHDRSCSLLSYTMTCFYRDLSTAGICASFTEPVGEYCRLCHGTKA